MNDGPSPSIAGPQRRRHVRRGRSRLCRDRRGGTLAGRPRPRRRRQVRCRSGRSGAIATAARPSPMRRLRPTGRRGRPCGARRLGGGIALEACCRVGVRRDEGCPVARPLLISGGDFSAPLAPRRLSYLAAAARLSLLRVGRRSMRRNRKQIPSFRMPTIGRSCYRLYCSSKLCGCWLVYQAVLGCHSPMYLLTPCARFLHPCVARYFPERLRFLCANTRLIS